MSEVAWERLDAKMIWVDAVQAVLSMTPAALAVFVLGVAPTFGTTWPVIFIAVTGTIGAANDVLRWIKTRYRITGDHVERRTGLIVRKYRSIQRDRIRSVETEARLRHRITGLRVVKIGAGQQNATGEKALSLNAVSRSTAERLRRELLGEEAAAEPDEHVLARIRYSWIVYNMFSIWAYGMAAGLLWGVYWLAVTFGLDPLGRLAGLLDWEALGRPVVIGIGILAVGAVGVGGLAINFITEYWDFRLVRAAGEDGTVLRTTQGLFRRREINRDDNRLRGVTISEPLIWRWMRMADTTVITTGLSMWSMATTIVPRGPVGVARPVAAAVLEAGEKSPFDAQLRRHPRSALRRRAVWATMITLGVTGVLIWAAGPGWWVAGPVLWPLLLALAWAAYRALGHAIDGDYVVARSGMMARATSALQRRAVSGASVRQSVLQRRLGLATVSLTTAAGDGVYEAPDMRAEEAVDFMAEAAPGLWDPFQSPRDHGIIQI